ncbi:MAG: DUF5677 domain-containing protein [Chitinophagaceae bacterium]
MPKRFRTLLLEKYKEINAHIVNYNSTELNDLGQLYVPTLKAAFIKCFEFNLYLNQTRNLSNSFYNISFLRGVCEDLFSLKFLLNFKKEDRDELLIIYNQYLLHTSIESQTKFFDKEKIVQPILRRNTTQDMVSKLENDLKQFWSKHGYSKDKIFPSVEHMAIDSKLKLLYDFLYHATSRAVHFSPNVLLRTGWYNKEGGPVVFSTKNFSNYYTFFNSYWGTYLFIQYARAFKKELKFDNNINKLIKELNVILQNIGEVPEIITFEEMNLKRPEKYPYRILNMILKMQNEERKAFYDHLPEIIIDLKKKKNKEKYLPLITILSKLKGAAESKSE